MTAAAVAAKGVPAAFAAVAAPPNKGAWAAAAVKAFPGPVRTPVAQPIKPANQPIKAAAPTAVQQQQPAPRLDDGTKIMFGDIELSSEFRDWCREQIRRFLDTEDLGLIDVLLSLESRSEVADTCQMVMGNRTGEQYQSSHPFRIPARTTGPVNLFCRCRGLCCRVPQAQGCRGAPSSTEEEESEEVDGCSHPFLHHQKRIAIFSFLFSLLSTADSMHRLDFEMFLPI